MSEEGQQLIETNRLACIMVMIYKLYQHFYGYRFENEVKTKRTYVPAFYLFNGMSRKS